MTENDRLAEALSSELDRINTLYRRGNISAEEFLKALRTAMQDNDNGY